MEIFIVLIQDSHSDPNVIPFKDRYEAIDYAKNECIDRARSPESLEQQKIEGWEFYCEYGSCGSVTVFKRELQ